MCRPNCGHQVPLDKALLHQGNCLFVLSVALALMVGLSSNLVFGSSPPAKKRSKLDRNITAIGQRGLGGGKSLGNWYSLEKEKEIGQQMSASLERSVTILSDAKTTSYVDRLAHRIAQNSDARMPVTVRVIDTQEAYALSLAGGYQYLTRGLLLRIGSEGELASALARGIAHTALRSATKEYTKAYILQVASIPPVFAGQSVPIFSTADSFTLPMTFLQMRRDEELDADYFGVQYLYKSGYDTDCFIRFIQTVWPANSLSGDFTARGFSFFFPVSQRLEALRNEITDILPPRDGETTSTPEFVDFQEHLRSLPGLPDVESGAPSLLRRSPPPAER